MLIYVFSCKWLYENIISSYLYEGRHPRPIITYFTSPLPPDSRNLDFARRSRSSGDETFSVGSQPDTNITFVTTKKAWIRVFLRFGFKADDTFVCFLYSRGVRVLFYAIYFQHMPQNSLGMVDLIQYLYN